jgi:hypothetical protein
MYGMSGTLGTGATAHITALSGMRPDDTIPTVKCEVTPKGNLRFFCHWCEHWHMHGGGYGDPHRLLLGHRSTHCTQAGGPYQQGYYLAVAGYDPTQCAFCGTPPEGTKLVQTWEGFWVCDWHTRQQFFDAKTAKEILRGLSKRVRGKRP